MEDSSCTGEDRFSSLQIILDELLVNDLIRVEKHYWTPESKNAISPFSVTDFAILQSTTLQLNSVLKNKLVFTNCFIKLITYSHLLEAQKKKLHKIFLDRVTQMELSSHLELNRRKELKLILLKHAQAAKDVASVTRIEGQLYKAHSRKKSVFQWRSGNSNLKIQELPTGLSGRKSRAYSKSLIVWNGMKDNLLDKVMKKDQPLDNVLLSAIETLREQPTPERLESFLVQRTSAIIEVNEKTATSKPLFSCFGIFKKGKVRVVPVNTATKSISNTENKMFVLKGKRANASKSVMSVASGFIKRPTYLKMLSESALKIIIKNLIESIDNWAFDVFEFERCSHGQPLFILSRILFEKLSLISALGLSEQTVINFSIEVEKGYPDNPYHNSLHAADVLLTVNVILFYLPLALCKSEDAACVPLEEFN